MTSRAKPHLLFVVGSTACGKSDLAVHIAENANLQSGEPAVEIINSDSVAFYDAVQIGAAKPGSDLLARAKHHLVGHVPRRQKYTAGDFRRDALTLIESGPTSRYVVVGGSGFYAQALEKGMYDVAATPPEIKAQLAAQALTPEGIAKLYEELQARDPVSAGRIAPADHYRTLRALEVLRSDPRGLTMAEIKAEFESTKPEASFTHGKVGLFRPRDVLRQKIAERTQKMLSDGLITEVENLRAEGLGSWAPLRSVGYKEVQAYLDGSLAFDALESAIVTSTMQLAKQQMTWFKRDPSTRWFDTDSQWQDAVEFGTRLL